MVDQHPVRRNTSRGSEATTEAVQVDFLGDVATYDVNNDCGDEAGACVIFAIRGHGGSRITQAR
jgi:hypothetical protein